MDAIRALFWNAFVSKGLDHWPGVYAEQGGNGHLLVVHQLANGHSAREVLIAFHHSVISAMHAGDAARRARIVERAVEQLSLGLTRYVESAKDVDPFLVRIGEEALDA